MGERTEQTRVRDNAWLAYTRWFHPTESMRVRVNHKISAKGLFQPDITSEAETVETAMANLRRAKDEMSKFAAENGWKEGAE